MDLSFAPTTADDFEVLLELRLEAMRESLVSIGRFDPKRSAERFRSSFVPAQTVQILRAGIRVGFFALSEHEDHLYLDHLYIGVAYQSSGIGSRAMAHILAIAKRKQLSVRLGALRSSRSNTFYRRHGFSVTSESEWDIYYEHPV